MIIKILEKDLEQFVLDNKITDTDRDRIIFVMIMETPSDYIYLDMQDIVFDTNDSRIEIQKDIETVENDIDELNALKNHTSLEKKLFLNVGVVEISNGKTFFMDSQSRIDILTTVLLSVVKPESKPSTIPWKTPDGVVDVTIEELTEALLKLMQTRKDLVGL